MQLGVDPAGIIKFLEEEPRLIAPGNIISPGNLGKGPDHQNILGLGKRRQITADNPKVLDPIQDLHQLTDDRATGGEPQLHRH